MNKQNVGYLKLISLTIKMKKSFMTCNKNDLSENDNVEWKKLDKSSICSMISFL